MGKTLILEYEEMSQNELNLTIWDNVHFNEEY